MSIMNHKITAYIRIQIVVGRDDKNRSRNLNCLFSRRNLPRALAEKSSTQQAPYVTSAIITQSAPVCLPNRERAKNNHNRGKNRSIIIVKKSAKKVPKKYLKYLIRQL